jgi:hypothetical protein
MDFASMSTDELERQCRRLRALALGPNWWAYSLPEHEACVRFLKKRRSEHRAQPVQADVVPVRAPSVIGPMEQGRPFLTFAWSMAWAMLGTGIGTLAGIATAVGRALL